MDAGTNGYSEFGNRHQMSTIQIWEVYGADACIGIVLVTSWTKVKIELTLSFLAL
jgi:hypothetical protein